MVLNEIANIKRFKRPLNSSCQAIRSQVLFLGTRRTNFNDELIENHFIIAFCPILMPAYKKSDVGNFWNVRKFGFFHNFYNSKKPVFFKFIIFL